MREVNVSAGIPMHRCVSCQCYYTVLSIVLLCWYHWWLSNSSIAYEHNWVEWGLEVDGTMSLLRDYSTHGRQTFPMQASLVVLFEGVVCRQWWEWLTYVPYVVSSWRLLLFKSLVELETCDSMKDLSIVMQWVVVSSTQFSHNISSAMTWIMIL